MRRESWIMVALSVYAILVLYFLLGNVLHDRIAYPFLPIPFLIDQLYLLLTRTHRRMIYGVNVAVVGFAIAVIFYLVVK